MSTPNDSEEIELLKRCLVEMVYAGWNEPIKDNANRWYLFCDVLGYIHPPVESKEGLDEHS